MTEETEIIQDKAEEEVTIPETVIPVKYNKEIRNLSVAEATELSQKGLKFESVSRDLERLKKLAGDRSIGDYITALEEKRDSDMKQELLEKCGGNEEIADRIIELEKKGAQSGIKGFEEFSEYFPEKDISEIPESVISAAKLRNGNLLDEYLRYEQKCRNDIAAAKKTVKENEIKNIGSQRSEGENVSAEMLEFSRGLWGR